MLLDRPLRHVEAKPKKSASDAFGSPGCIVGRHALDEGDEIGCKLRLPRSIWFRTVAPEDPESSTMPSQYGVGLHQKQGITPGGNQPGEQHKQASLMGLERRPLHPTRHHDQLLTKQGVLCALPMLPPSLRSGEHGAQFRPGPQHVLGDSGDQRRRKGKSSPRGIHSCRRMSGEGPKPTGERRNHDHDVAWTG